MLRLTHRELEARSMLENVPFLAVALSMVVATYFLLRRSRAKPPGYAFSLLLAAGLLLYPSTLAHYALLLVVPLLFSWLRHENGRAEIAMAAFTGLVLGATGISHGLFAFWSMAAVWILLAARVGFSSAGSDIRHVARAW
jgi:hypothetical protein